MSVDPLASKLGYDPSVEDEGSASSGQESRCTVCSEHLFPLVLFSSNAEVVCFTLKAIASVDIWHPVGVAYCCSWPQVTVRTLLTQLGPTLMHLPCWVVMSIGDNECKSLGKMTSSWEAVKKIFFPLLKSL